MRRRASVGVQKAYANVAFSSLICSSLRDSYTSLKLIRQRHLLAQIQTINNKKKKSLPDLEALERLNKELEPINKFLDEARQQRNAILEEIGMNYHLIISLMFSKLGKRLQEVRYCR